MMKITHTHTLGSPQSAAQLNLKPITETLLTGIQKLGLMGLLVGSLLLMSVQSWAVDPFAPPAKDAASQPPSFPSVAALVEATRSGEIPRSLTSKDVTVQVRYQRGVGNSLLTILMNQGLISKSAVRHDTASMISLILTNLAKLELSERKDESSGESFQRNWKSFGELNRLNENPRLRDELDSIFRQYSQAVKESVVLKGEADNRRLAEQAEKQRQADLVVQKMAEESAQRRAMAASQAASKQAEDQTRQAAVAQAMQAQAGVKKKKLEEILASPKYKQWEAAVQVEEGVRLIQTGERDLAAEDKVERISGVADLKARRAAGERVAAGKLLVEQSFPVYRQLGGNAPTPEEVKAGADPAAEYR